MNILTDEEILAAMTPEAVEDDYYLPQTFARAIEAAVLAKLAAQDGEPVGWLCEGALYEVQQHRLFTGKGPIPGQEKLYTETQLLAAQQRTAEACAKVCDEQHDKALTSPAAHRADCCATRIRNGEWREYL